MAAFFLFPQQKNSMGGFWRKTKGTGKLAPAGPII
jgi:hypothetical protein